MLPRSLAVLALACVVALAGCASIRQTSKGGAPELAPAQQAAAVFATPRRIALVVGINGFDDAQWHPLHYAVKDAHDLAGVLNDTRYGRFDQVVVLSTPEQTTRAAILTALHDLTRRNTSPHDTILVYLSTHGTLARTADGRLHQYLVTSDTRFDDIPDTAIDVAALKQDLNGLRSQKKVLVLASCHSGRGKSQLSGELMGELKTLKAPFFVKPLGDVSEATVVLSASAWGETAREDSSLENDVYTHFLIEGIKKGDRNGDGAVTVTEAHDFAKEQTYYITKGAQRPSIESIITGEDPIVLAGRVQRSGKPVLYDYSQDFRDMVILVDGEKKGTLPMGVAVDPGVHTVTLKAGDGDRALYDEVFTARQGQRIFIPTLINGYDQGTALRIGYQGFITQEVDRSVAKPMPMVGLSYSNHAYFSPQWGYRADVSYGKASQDLQLGAITAPADVSETDVGLAVLYRRAYGGLAVYAGPRAGALMITRTPHVSLVPSESNTSPTVGGLTGLHFRYKRQVSLALEGAVNYAGIKVGGTDTSSFFYSLIASVSVNF